MGRSYTSRKRAAVTFDLDGVEFTAAGGISLLDLVEVARLADVDAASPAGVAALGDFFEAALGKEEYHRFRVHCREHGTDPETLLSIMEDLVEDVGGRPTERPSPSGDGRPAAGSTSRVVSLSRGTVVDLPLDPARESELRQAVARAAG